MATVWVPLPNSSCLPPSHKAVIAPGLGTPPVRHSCASPQHCGRPAKGSSSLAPHPPSPPPNNNKRFSLAPPSDPPNSKCACKPQIDADGISGGQSAPLPHPPHSSASPDIWHIDPRIANYSASFIRGRSSKMAHLSLWPPRYQRAYVHWC